MRQMMQVRQHRRGAHKLLEKVPAAVDTARSAGEPDADVQISYPMTVILKRGLAEITAMCKDCLLPIGGLPLYYVQFLFVHVWEGN